MTRRRAGSCLLAAALVVAAVEARADEPFEAGTSALGGGVSFRYAALRGGAPERDHFASSVGLELVGRHHFTPALSVGATMAFRRLLGDWLGHTAHFEIIGATARLVYPRGPIRPYGEIQGIVSTSWDFGQAFAGWAGGRVLGGVTVPLARALALDVDVGVGAHAGGGDDAKGYFYRSILELPSPRALLCWVPAPEAR